MASSKAIPASNMPPAKASPAANPRNRSKCFMRASRWVFWEALETAKRRQALCRELRARSAALPIIFLTARDSDFDIVAGLRLGADDYLTKDVSLPHLLARIAALFRRAELAAQPQAAEERLERGALELDLKRFSVTWRGSAVALTLTEFWMVHALCKFPEHVKSREQLMREANLVVDEGTITSHVKRIRRKFLAADASFAAIDTVYGMGYRWKS